MRPSTSVSSSDAATEMEREWQASILRCTNQLFVNLKIPTQPIRNFAELQKSASSMFVGIFETMFNLRLKNVARNPRVVNDYVNNAQLVIEALADSLSLDLAHVTGEGVYRGDAAQIQVLLDIFDNLWNQFFQPAEQREQQRSLNDTGNPLVSSEQGEPKNPESTPMHEQQQRNSPDETSMSAATNSGEDVNESEEFDGSRSAEFEEFRAADPARNGGPIQYQDLSSRVPTANKKNPSSRSRVANQRATRTKIGHGKPHTRQSKVGSKRTRNVQRNTDRSFTRPSSTVRDRSSRVALQKHQTQRRSSTKQRNRPEKGSVSSDVAKARRAVSSAAKVLDTVNKLEKRPGTKQEENTAHEDKLTHDTLSDLNRDIEEMEGKVRLAALRTLAEKFPDVYQSMWRTMQHQHGRVGSGIAPKERKRDGKLKRGAPKKMNERKTLFAKRMEQDIERYQKSYKLLVKQQLSESRAASNVSRARARVAMKNQKKDSKTKKIITNQLNSQLSQQQRSKKMSRSNREEQLMRKLFQNAVNLEHQRLLAYKQAEQQRINEIEEEQLNRYESTQREFADRQAMLQEKIQQHNSDQKLVEQAQRLALRHLAREVEQDYRHKLERMQQDWEQQEQHMLFANTERITNEFEKLNTKVVDFTANQIRALKDISDPSQLTNDQPMSHMRQIQRAAEVAFPQAPIEGLSKSTTKL